MHTYPSLPVAVVQERRRQGMTIVDLADRSGLSLHTVQRYTTRPYPGGRYEVLEALAVALGMESEVSVISRIPTDPEVTHGKPTPQAVAA